LRIAECGMRITDRPRIRGSGLGFVHGVQY